MNWWTAKRLERYGWAYYGAAPFTEDMSRILGLIGSALYEWMEFDGKVYVRRVQD